MQLVKTHRDNLLKPLQIVSGIVERRHTLPILANLLIRKKGNEISFLSTDIEIQITTLADFGLGDDDIATTVSARKLVDVLRSLSDGEVALSLDSKKLTVQSGKSRFTLQTLAAEDFPVVTPLAEIKASITISQKQLKALLGMVSFAMAQQDIRYYLNGMLLTLEGQTLGAVATDGHRLSYCAQTVEVLGEIAGRHEVIVPRKTILELTRLLDDSDNPVKIEVGTNQIKFQFAQVELISKLVEGKFPDYQRVVPKGYKNSFTVKREDLQHALQRAAIMTSDKFKGVRWILADNNLKIVSINADQEEANEELELDYQGEALDIGFNVVYLLDILSNIKTENMQISLGDANSSALFTLAENAEFKYVVMPMRI